MLIDSGNMSIAPDGKVYTIPDTAARKAAFADLTRRAQQMRQRGRRVVAVQGLGFVGCAVAAVVADAADTDGSPLYFVIGIEKASGQSYWKAARLEEARPPVSAQAPELDRLIHKGVRETGNLAASTCHQAYGLADIIIVDVGLDVIQTPGNGLREIRINLPEFEEAIESIGRHMRADALVLIETTVPAGTIERVAEPLLTRERKKRGLKAPLMLAHAYERVMPGPGYVDSIRSCPRTFAGLDENSSDRARDFLSSFIQVKTHPLAELADTRHSELAKLLENSYRAVNIAFIHEWTLLAEQMGIDLFSVIDSIRVRAGTHDNMRVPGFGVGGYCLTKDSFLAQWSSDHWFGNKVELSMTLAAMDINKRMPLHTLDLLNELAGESLDGRKITVCGLSYLPEVADARNSPTRLLVDELTALGARVTVHDPYVLSWPERPDVQLGSHLGTCLSGAQGIVFAVPHKMYQDLSPQQLIQYVGGDFYVVDAQNVLHDAKAKYLHSAGCRLAGVGKGHWRKQEFQCPKV